MLQQLFTGCMKDRQTLQVKPLGSVAVLLHSTLAALRSPCMMPMEWR